jgi:nodulation protein E
MRRVVVSGLGVVSSAGTSVEAFWANLVAGTGAFTEAASSPGTGIRVGAVIGDDHARDLPLPSLAPLDRSGVFAVAAAGQALADAGLTTPFARPERVAVILGCGGGGLSSMDEQFRRLYAEKKRAHPLAVARAMASGAASWTSIAFGARGPCFVTSSACASSAHAIGTAAALIRAGVVDVAVTGGTEAPLDHGTLTAWDAMKVMSRTVCRPFSQGRDGLMISEGAGIIVLEAEAHARARGRADDIELAGWAAGADARDLFAPSPDGMAAAMRDALAVAGIEPQAIDWINAHGTATRANDIAEVEALRAVFGADACPPTTSTKGVHGHALGASGGLEAVATVLAMRNNLAPPTAGFLEADPECPIDCIPGAARPMRIDAALSNSFAFGGLNASLAFRRLRSAA